jgi:hypothetical protein
MKWYVEPEVWLIIGLPLGFLGNVLFLVWLAVHL